MNEKSEMTDEKLIQTLKEKVDPLLAEHLGGSELVGFEEGVAKVRLTGACATCPSAELTMESVVKEIVLENCPEVKDVVIDKSISDDLLDMARKMLNKNVN